MKKSFTLAETLVTLTVLGVIMAIVMPLINKAKPDKDIMIFKKGMYTIQSVVGNATELLLNQGASSRYIWGDADIVNDTAGALEGPDGFCERIADQLNTSKVDCLVADPSYNTPQIITTDGIRYWNLPTGAFGNLLSGGASPTGTTTICMDRTFTNKEASVLSEVRTFGAANTAHNPTAACGSTTIGSTANVPAGLRVVIRQDGKVSVPNNSYESDLVDKSFQVQKDES